MSIALTLSAPSTLNVLQLSALPLLDGSEVSQCERVATTPFDNCRTLSRSMHACWLLFAYDFCMDARLFYCWVLHVTCM